jgi:hypothetical protein
MNIHVAHSRSFDFKTELYEPIKNSSLSKEHTFIFPHDENSQLVSSKELFQTGCDLVIAEVSHPATGMGIELGWADMLNIPIICIYKNGSNLSHSLKAVTNTFLEYSDTNEMITKIIEGIKIIDSQAAVI